jgi:hypothetical protein
MSGFEGKSGWYGLTPTKAAYWHRYRECGCRGLDDIVNAHLVDDGFTVQDHRTWVRVTGPGLVDGWVSDLYLAISGAPPERARRDPAQQWSY